MKVLLLEDNLSLAEIIKEMLESKEYIVDFFTNGEDALYNCVNGYDCFILDINVPLIDGLTLLKEIRQINKSTPAIIISSNIEMETIKTAYSVGCTDFLKKPFYIFELENKIDILCKRKSKIDLLGNYSYDFDNEELYDDKNKEIKLTHKEKLFMTLMLKSANKTVALTAIEQYVWEGEIASIMSIRSLVKRLRNKLPKNSISTQNYGYTLCTK